jgi:rare lipoprotein A
MRHHAVLAGLAFVAVAGIAFEAAAGDWSATVTRTPVLVREPALQRAPSPAVAPAPRPAAAMVAPKPRIALRGPRHALSGIASFYGQGEVTASGERYDKQAMTAAHPTLPFGTKVRVHCRNTGRDVVVRINDRGPFKPGRVIDLSEAAADAIGMRGRGLAAVQLEVVSR